MLKYKNASRSITPTWFSCYLYCYISRSLVGLGPVLAAGVVGAVIALGDWAVRCASASRTRAVLAVWLRFAVLCSWKQFSNKASTRSTGGVRSWVKTFKTAQYPGSMKVSSAHGFTWSGGWRARGSSGGLNYAKNAQLVSERACKGPGRAAWRRTQ